MNGQITMNPKEQDQISVIEKVIRKEMKQKVAAKQLGESVRQLRRQVKKYKNGGGAKALVHKARGKVSNRAIPQAEIDRIIKLVRAKYLDFGPTFALEKLQEFDGVTLKVERLRQAMIEAGIWTPHSRKKPHVHQLRERRSCFGELVQIDGSPHDWFEGRRPPCCLLVFIDDATGKLTWLHFCDSESTRSYFKATKGYLLKHSRPLAFYSDKHGVFRINKQKDGMANENTGLTQ